MSQNSTHIAYAESGAVIISWDPNTKRGVFRYKCEQCGHMPVFNISFSIATVGRHFKGTHHCPKCKENTRVFIGMGR